MKSIQTCLGSCLLPLAMIAGLCGTSSQIAGAEKSAQKSKKATTGVAKTVILASQKSVPLTDDDILDQGLQNQGVRPVGDQVLPPNCTDVTGSPGSSSWSNAIPSMPGPVPPESPSLLDPNSVLSTPTQTPSSDQLAQSNPSQSPAQLAPLPTGQGGAQMLAYAPSMIGNFFGGNSSGTSVSNFNLGNATNSLISPIDPTHFRILELLGGVPTQYQTSPQAGTLVTGIPGVVGGTTGLHLNNLTLVDTGTTALVHFNNPEPTGPPNSPRSVEIYRLVSNPVSGGTDPSLATGRMMISENTSPLPRDRVFFNFSYFDGTRLAPGGINVTRFTPGFEKTFLNGDASIEVRTPFASTLSSTIDTSTGAATSNDVQWGNVTMYAKALAYRSQTFALSTGMGITLPTANNVVFVNNGQVTTRVTNDSVHLMPFIGSLYTPNARFYTQNFLQFDFDSNGNRVYSIDNTFKPNNSLTRSGVFQDSTFLFCSAGVGYWTYLSDGSGRMGLSGISPTAELHYNRSLQKGDVVRSQNGSTYGQSFSNLEVLDAVVGVNAKFGPSRLLTAGFATPLGFGVDKQFHGEFRLMANWFFGPSATPNRMNRIQF